MSTETEVEIKESSFTALFSQLFRGLKRKFTDWIEGPTNRYRIDEFLLNHGKIHSLTSLRLLDNNRKDKQGRPLALHFIVYTASWFSFLEIGSNRILNVRLRRGDTNNWNHPLIRRVQEASESEVKANVHYLSSVEEFLRFVENDTYLSSYDFSGVLSEITGEDFSR